MDVSKILFSMATVDIEVKQEYSWLLSVIYPTPSHLSDSYYYR